MISVGLLWQNAYYAGNALGYMLYGVEIALYCWTLRALACYARESHDERHRHTSNIFGCFSTVFLLLATVFVSTQAVFGAQMWVIHPGYAGGMNKYYADHASVWHQTLAHIAMVALQLSSDGFLIYRFYFVWETCLPTRWMLILPCTLWSACVGLGSLLCFYCATQRGNLFAGEAFAISVAYYVLAISLNLLVTSMIFGRIMTLGWLMHERFGSGASGRFFCTASLIVESTLPRTVIGIVFLVSYALGSEISVAFLSLYVMLTMLILHVVHGSSRNREPETFVSPSSSPTSLKPPPLDVLLGRATGHKPPPINFLDKGIPEV